MKNMLSSVVASSKACGLLMVSSAPLMDRHLFTCRDWNPQLIGLQMQGQCHASRPCWRGSGHGCTILHGLAGCDTNRAAGLHATSRQALVCLQRLTGGQSRAEAAQGPTLCRAAAHCSMWVSSAADRMCMAEH